jgi:hypothetical protein
MLLFAFLIVPIILWFLPLAALREQKDRGLKNYYLNFGGMLLSCLLFGLLFWYLQLSFPLIMIILLLISSSWGLIYHFLRQKF